MRKTLVLFLFSAQLLFGANECVHCHKETQKIRDASSGMMQAIMEVAQKSGHEGNDCIVCHGGTPEAKKKELAHASTVHYFKTNKGPKEFYPAPSDHKVNQNSCGACHENQVASQKNSLMTNNQETIQSVLEDFGVAHKKPFGLIATSNPIEETPRLGTTSYQKYMQELQKKEPHAFDGELEKLPRMPSSNEVQKEPTLAAYSYLHQKHASKEMACATCHLPKNKENKLVHSIQSSRDTNVSVDGDVYSGISLKTCATCHSNEKSISTSYTGLMEKESPSSQKYLHMQEDIHFKKGMLCQDCHTSNDLHGDGFLNAASVTSVEIECQDCHGTTKAYPWELPLGFSDEFNTSRTQARGTTKTVAEYLKQGSISEVNEGYLITARGNPLPHVTKKANKISLALANGKNIELSPLKTLKKEKKLSKKALLAMNEIDAHTNKMECYTCHTVWAVQNYDTHLKIDYKDKKSSTPTITQTKAFVRWEEPALMQNAEGRVAPSVPSNRSHVTVITEDAKEHFLKTPNDKNMQMQALQPHAVQKESRSCESCHTSSKTLGMPVEGLRVFAQEENLLDTNNTHNKGFSLLAPLSKEQKESLDRSGMCFSCHKDIPKGNLAISALSHITKMTQTKIDTTTHNQILNKYLSLGAWAQVFGAGFILFIILFGVYFVFLKKQPRNPRNEGWK